LEFDERRTTMSNQHMFERVAVWREAEYVLICEWVSPRLNEGDHERRYREQARHQGPDNSVFGRLESPANVEIDRAYRVSDKDWETGLGDDARVELS
jgi:hypothetical protein